MALQRPPDAPNLKGFIYIATEEGLNNREFIVLKDDGADTVWVDNVEPPHRGRWVLRRRLFTYRYKLVGREDPNGRRLEGPAEPAPTFNGAQFARWLRGWMESEGIAVTELARASDIGEGTIHQLRRGQPNKAMRDRGQTSWTPALQIIVNLAHGLGLQLSYVLSKAGLTDDGDRWANFSESERLALAIVLDADDAEDAQELDSRLRELVNPPTRMKEKV